MSNVLDKRAALLYVLAGVVCIQGIPLWPALVQGLITSKAIAWQAKSAAKCLDVQSISDIQPIVYRNLLFDPNAPWYWANYQACSWCFACRNLKRDEVRCSAVCYCDAVP